MTLNLLNLKLSSENRWSLGFSFYNMLKKKNLEICNISFRKFCDADEYEELEMDNTDSLYLALSEEILEDVILPEKRDEWKAMRSRDCTDIFTANATDILFPRICCNTHKKHDKRKPGLFKEELRCTQVLCLRSKKYCCRDRKSKEYRFSRKGLNKRTLEDCGDVLMSKNRKVLDEPVIVTSTNRGFRTVQHGVVTYDQTRKNCPVFSQNEMQRMM